jgi:dipeptidyl-peptidase-4
VDQQESAVSHAVSVGARLSAVTDFPRQYAETQAYSLGRPRSFTAGDGRVLFLRSRRGDDPVQCLWVLDDDGERMVVDPLLLSTAEDLTPEEAARRERARERAGGITTYATDDALAVAAFALSGALGIAHVDGPTALVGPTGVADPRPSPDGTTVGYVQGSRLVVADLDGSELWSVSGPDGTTCGLPDFIASEELDRFRGWWWSPDSGSVLAAVVDDSMVDQWWISDPADPARAPVPQRYPAAGTPNAVVTLLHADADGSRQVAWDHDALPYLVGVHWSSDGPALLHLASRDQKRFVTMTVDGDVVREDASDSWLDVVAGVPRWLPGGRLLHVVEDTAADVRRIAVDGQAVTPADVHVFAVRGIDPDGDVVFTGHEQGDPTSRYVYAWDGTDTERLTEDPGVYDIVVGGDTQVGVSMSMDHFGTAVEVLRGGETVSVWSEATTPPFVPVVHSYADGDLHVAVLLPADHVVGTKLPVLVDPYGGPGGHQENLLARNLWLEPQWLADQGFAVVVADGRGTSGVGLAWEKAIAHDFTVTLDDQVAALQLAASHEPDLDLGRVGIRGWSFGGWLAALAVLDRPDVFHAAVAGAPVTDQRLYDTAYSERYLGVDPDGEGYRRSDLVARAGSLTRPLLLIHGLADDNVFAAHTLQLSAALLAAGRPHDVLPLTGATHLGGGAVVRANLLRHQVDWLRRNLPV